MIKTNQQKENKMKVKKINKGIYDIIINNKII